MTAVRYRLHDSHRWGAGRLVHVAPFGSGDLQVEVIDSYSGNTRVLDTTRHLIAVETSPGRWQPVADHWTKPALWETS